MPYKSSANDVPDVRGSGVPDPFRNMHDPIKRVIDAFGVERSLWGTDFSRLPDTCTYRQAVTMFTQELDFLRGDDLEMVMGKSIARFFGWPAAV